MNDTSSRTHCCVELKLYKKIGTQVHVSSFKLFDLAGSEKYKDLDPRQNPALANKGNDFPIEMYEAIMTNLGLLELQKVVNHVTALKKPLTGGETLPNSVGWKATAITKLIKSSFNGGAFTCLIFCISQHEKNGREGFNSMEVAQSFSKLKCNVTKPKPFDFDKFVKDTETELASDRKKLEELEDSNRNDAKARLRRR